MEPGFEWQETEGRLLYHTAMLGLWAKQAFLNIPIPFFLYLISQFLNQADIDKEAKVPFSDSLNLKNSVQPALK